jgi:hypothetical protein
MLLTRDLSHGVLAETSRMPQARAVPFIKVYPTHDEFVRDVPAARHQQYRDYVLAMRLNRRNNLFISLRYFMQR